MVYWYLKLPSPLVRNEGPQTGSSNGKWEILLGNSLLDGGNRTSSNFNHLNLSQYSVMYFQMYFILLNRYGCTKNEPKFKKKITIFLTLISLITVHSSYSVTLFSCLTSISSYIEPQLLLVCLSDGALSNTFFKVPLLVHVYTGMPQKTPGVALKSPSFSFYKKYAWKKCWKNLLGNIFFGAMSFKQYHNMFGCNTGTIKEFPDNTDLVSSWLKYKNL